jgi:hypothetical protein
MSWVKVIGAAIGREVFVNGNHVDAAGFIGTPFEVDAGLDTFELLTLGGTVEQSVGVVIADQGSPQNPQIVNMSSAPAAKTGAISSGSTA